MNEKELLSIFKECGALEGGHFMLSSGLHSKNYLQAALVLQYPKKAELLCKELAEKFKDEKIDVVIGPALGGITLSYELARSLNARSIFSERVDGKMTLRRSFDLKEGEKVLIAEDVITTGGSVEEIVSLVKLKNAHLAGIAALVDRSSNKEKFKDLGFKSLLKLDIKTYPPEDCPLCKEGLPLIKPGSRK